MGCRDSKRGYVKKAASSCAFSLKMTNAFYDSPERKIQQTDHLYGCFIDEELNKYSNLTTSKVYSNVLSGESVRPDNLNIRVKTSFLVGRDTFSVPCVPVVCYTQARGVSSLFLDDLSGIIYYGEAPMGVEIIRRYTV